MATGDRRHALRLACSLAVVVIAVASCGAQASPSPSSASSAAAPSASAAASESAAPSADASASVSPASASPAAGGKEIDSLVWAATNPASTLDPALVYDSAGGNYVTFAECEGLTRFDDQGKAQPQIAASWAQPDPLTYVIELRTDVKFWDGNPLTADDVAFSLNRINDAKLASPLTGLVTTIASVAKSGPSEVTVKLKSPDPVLPLKLATPAGQVVEAAFAQKQGADFGTAVDKVMCTGPFKPVAWTKGEKVEFDRQDNYWDQTRLPKVKHLTIQTISDAATYVAGLKSGTIDGTFDLDGRNAQTLTGDSSLVVDHGQGMTINFIALNSQAGPFADAKLRKAMNLAIDRAGLASAVSGAFGEPLTTFVAPGQSSWKTDVFDAAIKAVAVPTSPDVAAATQLVKDAGKEGASVTITYGEGPVADIVGPAIQQAGTSIGLNVTLKKLPTSDFYSVLGDKSHPFEGIVANYVADYTDWSGSLVVMYQSPYNNLTGLNDPKYTALVDQWSKAEPFSDAQAQILIQMNQLISDQSLYVPLYVDPLVQVHSAKVCGYSQIKTFFYQNFAQSLSGC